MITLISKLFGLFAVIAQILGLVLIAVGIFVPEARSYFIIRGVVLTILGGFGFYFHDKLDEYFYIEKLDDGTIQKISFDRKTLRRNYSITRDDIQTESSFRERERITLKQYNSELEYVRELFLEGNKI